MIDQCQTPEKAAAFIGIDWADREHAVCMLVDGDKTTQLLPHSAEEIAQWAAMLHKRFGGRQVAVALEQSRGSLVHALMKFPHLTIYPINPKQSACYRTALSVSGAISDPADAAMLARFLREHHEQLRPWQPDDGQLRELARLCELRRKVVQTRKKTVQQLTSTLKVYFPEALDLLGNLQRKWALEVLGRWSSLQELKRVNPKTLAKYFCRNKRADREKIDERVNAIRALQPMITDKAIVNANAIYVEALVEQIKKLNEAVARFDKAIGKLFNQQEDAVLFSSLPGAGAAMAPRLLVALGSDRERFNSAKEVQAYSGIAPVTRSSGKSHKVSRRYGCNKYLRQTFHEFADHARRWSPWSKAFYKYQKSKGKNHHAILRELAFKWIRIIYRMWKTREHYDEAKYIEQLKLRGSPIIKFLQND